MPKEDPSPESPEPSVDRTLRDSGALRRRWLPVLAVLVPLAGCNSEPPPPSDTIPEQSDYGGLSPEEIQRQAIPMTLEEAERLGIVDSTIRIEVPSGPDSLLDLPLDSGGRRP
jgi:hypothetical protein